ncbi:MAG: hypothetical protein LBR40_05375 [Bacilli bacterium]|jgi:hypothetical protein|nr:hypothetical protein [Bacilli bacterium]
MSVLVERFVVSKTCRWCTNLIGIYEAENWEKFNSKYSGRNNPFGRHSFCDCSIRSYYTYDNNKVLLQRSSNAKLSVSLMENFSNTDAKEYLLNSINAICYAKRNNAKYYDILNHYSIRAKLFKVNDTSKIVNNTTKAFETKELNVLKQLKNRFGGLFSKVKEMEFKNIKEFRPDAIWINEKLFSDKKARFVEMKQIVGSSSSINKELRKANEQLKAVKGKQDGIVFLDIVRTEATKNRTNKDIINDIIDRVRNYKLNNVIVRIDNNYLWFQPQEYSKSIK